MRKVKLLVTTKPDGKKIYTSNIYYFHRFFVNPKREIFDEYGVIALLENQNGEMITEQLHKIKFCNPPYMEGE